MKKFYFLLCYFFIAIQAFFLTANAQPPQLVITQQKTFGGTGDDYSRKLIATPDGGYLLVGSTKSNDGDVVGNFGGEDGWVVKLNSSMQIEWQKCYGGTSDDYFIHAIANYDGTFLLIGSTLSNDGMVSGNHGYSDIWVVKITSNGTVLWQKCYGGTNHDSATRGILTTDGGYVLIGSSYSNNGDLTANFGFADIWVVKINSSGTLIAQKNCGSIGSDVGFDIIQNAAGYMLVGYVSNWGGNITNFHGTYSNWYDNTDAWVVQLSTTGTIIWQKTIGGNNRDKFYRLLPTNDGNFLLLGTTNSLDGDPTPYYDSNGTYFSAHFNSYERPEFYTFAGYMVKINTSGTILDYAIIGGGSRVTQVYDAKILSDQSIIISLTGNGNGAASPLATDQFVFGTQDLQILRLSPQLDLKWQKCLGSRNYDYYNTFVITPAPKLMVLGTVGQVYGIGNDGDVQGLKGMSDVWLTELDFAHCNAPTNCTTQNINATTTKFKWNSVPGAISYNLRAATEGLGNGYFNPWTVAFNTTDTTLTVNSLTPCKDYQWQVQAICADGTPSNFSQISTSALPTFTTSGCKTNFNDPQSVDSQLFIKISPNPANNILHFETNVLEPTTAQVMLTNLEGKVYINQTLPLLQGTNNQSFDIQNLPQGLYILTCKTPTSTQQSKLSIVR